MFLGAFHRVFREKHGVALATARTLYEPERVVWFSLLLFLARCEWVKPPRCQVFALGLQGGAPGSPRYVCDWKETICPSRARTLKVGFFAFSGLMSRYWAWVLCVWKKFVLLDLLSLFEGCSFSDGCRAVPRLCLKRECVPPGCNQSRIISWCIFHISTECTSCKATRWFLAISKHYQVFDRSDLLRTF